jgi:hypothetical protein
MLFTRFLLLLLIIRVLHGCFGFRVVSNRGAFGIVRPLRYTTIPQIKLSSLHQTSKNSVQDGKSTSPVDAINNSKLSLGVGITGLLILFATRVLTLGDVVSDIQSRSDIITTIACSALLLNALSETDIVAKDREPVSLVGHYIKGRPFIYDKLDQKVKRAIRWAVVTILNNTPCTSVHVIQNDMILGAGGITGSYRINDDEPIDLGNMPVLRRCQSTGEEVYLPDLQVIPGKVEFTYLPINCQSVMLLPVNNDALTGVAIVVGTNQAKVLRQNDLNRIRNVLGVFQTLL